jgi:hypothetical protein
MALFELTELASYMQSDLDTASATLARTIATALVEEVTGPLESRTSVVNLPVLVDGTCELPATVVTAVTTVELDTVAQTFVWKRPLPVLFIDDWDPPDRDEWAYVEVTFTHGFPVVPPLAKAIALGAAARAYTVAPPPGVSLSIDDYSESTSAGADATSTTTLTEQERRALASLGGFVAAVTGP